MIFPSQARKESMALAFAELDKVANPVNPKVATLVLHKLHKTKVHKKNLI